MSHGKFKSCIEACIQCALECEHCATECLHEQDVKMLATCIELDRYCADMCSMAATFMARSDEHTISFVKKFCTLCAEICEACATECEKHVNMEHCSKCAETCRKCAEECRKMSSVSASVN